MRVMHNMICRYAALRADTRARRLLPLCASDDACAASAPALSTQRAVTDKALRYAIIFFMIIRYALSARALMLAGIHVMLDYAAACRHAFAMPLFYHRHYANIATRMLVAYVAACRATPRFDVIDAMLPPCLCHLITPMPLAYALLRFR